MTTSLIQQPLAGMEQYKRESSASQMLQVALENKAGIEIIERITAMMERERDYQSRVAFDEALNSCQSQIGRIKPNVHRENNIWWADYAQIDRTVRPIYIGAGFSISFSEEETADPMQLRMKATLSRSGVSKEYFAQISKVAANAKMSAQDASASAASRVKRYLMLDIFNIAVGIDTDEKVPFAAKPEDVLDESVVMDFIALIEGSGDVDDLKKNYLTATKAGASDPSALRAFDKAKKDTWKKRGFKA
jgi:hypothetical protein